VTLFNKIILLWSKLLELMPFLSELGVSVLLAIYNDTYGMFEVADARIFKIHFAGATFCFMFFFQSDLVIINFEIVN
jgi:hypothetical protein